jgi:hypothetical protein
MDTPRKPGTGSLSARDEPTTDETRLIVTRVAETWQFYAFVYAALITVTLALIDEIPDRLSGWRLAAKVVAIGVLTYLVLFNVTVRIRLATFLNRFKQERR